MSDNLLDALAESGKTLEEFVEAWLEAGGKLIGDPREELRWRLNEGLNGRDPGEPLNWRGERGLLFP